MTSLFKLNFKSVEDALEASKELPTTHAVWGSAIITAPHTKVGTVIVKYGAEVVDATEADIEYLLSK